MGKYSKGQSLLELIVVMGIFVSVVTSLAFFIFDSFFAGRLSYDLIKANFLAEEGIEAAKSIRDNNFPNLIAGNHGLAISSSHWIFQGVEENIDSQLNNGKRVILIEDVDSSRKKITSTVAWNFTENRPEEIKLISYLTNWQKITGDWSQPKFVSSYNATGTSDGTDLFFADNKIYLVTANNTGHGGSDPEFYILDVSNPTSPTLLGSLNLGAAANSIIVSGNYAYVASADNNQELKIVNVSNPGTLIMAGSYNASGNTDGRSVAISGTTVFLGRLQYGGAELFILNVFNPASVSLLGSYETGGDINGIYFDSNRVFLATSNSSQEFQLVNTANPSYPVEISYFNLGGTANSIFYSSSNDLAYLAATQNTQKLIIIGPGP
jgi:hypothetical protein